jgi:hypothetical protein
MPEFKKSTRAGKKYMVRSPKGKLIHFGAIKPDGTPYAQYEDKALGLYSRYDHKDKARRDRYRKRHQAIKTKAGLPAYKDPEQGSYYAYNFLW